MKRTILPLFLAMLLLPAANLAAGEGFSFLSFNLGQGFGLYLDGASDDIVSSSTFGIDFRVAGPLIVGFSRHSFHRRSWGTIPGSMLNIKFDVDSMLRPVLSFGEAWGMVTGLGFEIIPFRREVGGLVTEFKLAPQYFIWPEDGIGDGLFSVSLMLGIGF